MTRLRLAFIVVAISVIVAACGGSSTSSPVSEKPTPSSTATPVAALTDSGPSSDDPGEIALSYLQLLTRELGPRESATDEEARAAELIAEEIRKLGYVPEIRPFSVTQFSSDIPFLAISSPIEEVLDADFMVLTGVGEVVGPISSAGKGRLEEFPANGLDGAVALMERGDFPFEEKVQNAQNLGASAAVIYNNQPGNFPGTLETQADIPALSLSREDGLHLLDLLEDGEVVVDINVVREALPSQNVTTIKESIGSTIMVIVGAHYDTVSGTVGANDNASGVAVMLTLARELKDMELPFTVSFMAFGSEEIGLRGSVEFVRSLGPRLTGTVAAMLNFDSVGSGSMLITGGDASMVNLALEAATEMGIPLSQEPVPLGATSDHAVFQAVSIPAIYFTGDDFSRIHTPQDTAEFIDVDRLGDAVQMGLAIIEGLAENRRGPQ